MSNKSLGDLQLTIKASTDQFKTKLTEASTAADGFKNKVKSSLDGVGVSADGLKASFAGLFAGLTVGAAVAALNSAVDSMDKLNDVADATGASIEGISKLENIALKTGSSIDIVETALNKMVVQLKEADGTDGVSTALKSIGLNWQELKSMDPAEGFQKISVALSGLEDNSAKAQLMAVLFGKSYKDLAPYLKDVAENMDTVGTVTAEQASQAETLKKQLSALTAQYTALQKEAAGALLPTLVDIGNAFLSSGDDAKKSGASYEWLKTIIRGLSVLGVDVAYTFNVMGKEIGVIAAQLVAMAKGDFKGAFGIGGMGDQWRAEAENLRAQRDKTVAAIMAAGSAPPESSTTPGKTIAGGLGISGDKGKKGKTSKDNSAKEAAAAEKEFENYQINTIKRNTELAIQSAESLGMTKDQIETMKQELKLSQDIASIQSNDKLTATQKEQLITARQQTDQLETQIRATVTKFDTEKTAIKEINDLIANTPTAKLEEQRALIQRISEAYLSGKFGIVESTDATQKYGEVVNTALGNVAPVVKQAEEGIINLSSALNDAANSMTEAIINFTSGAKTSFGDMVRSFLAGIAKMILQQMIFNALKTGTNAMAGAGGVLSIIGSAMGGKVASANGNVFMPGAGGPNLVPFANGGVFNSPITFPVSGNKTGLMAEAGPEAIIPLSRRNGVLGVNASGLGGSNTTNIAVSVSVQGNTNDPGGLGSKVGEAVVRSICRSEIVNATRTGGVLNAI